MFTCLGLSKDFNAGYNLQEASSFSTSTPQYATPSCGKNFLKMQGRQGCSRRLDLPRGEEELREENAVSSVIAECHKVRFVLEDIRQTIIN